MPKFLLIICEIICDGAFMRYTFSLFINYNENYFCVYVYYSRLEVTEAKTCRLSEITEAKSCAL